MKNKNKFTNFFKTKGFSLLETTLVLIVAATVILGVYIYYRSVSASELVYRESQSIYEITKRVSSSYNSMADFSGITASSLIDSGAIPSNVSVGENSRIFSGFGGEIFVASENVLGGSNNGFSITYQDVPSRSCRPLVNAVNSVERYQSILINSTVVAEYGSIKEDSIGSACSEGNVALKVIYERENSSVTSPLGNCQLPSPDTQQRSKECSPGYTGEIIEERTASCPSTEGLPVWSSWSLSANNCELICVPAPSSPQTRVVACDADYVGTINQVRESICTAYTGTPSWTAWEDVSNNCELRCSVQIPTPNEDFRTVSCPTGYHGSRIERRTFSCPNVTGSPVPGGWGLHEDNCTVMCQPQLPTPNPQKRWLNGSSPCPADHSGSITYEYEQSKTWTCPAGSPSLGNPIEGAWVDTGARRNETNTCVPNCTPDAPLERWVTKSSQCQSGTAGSITWEQRQTRTSVCQPGNSNPTTSAWQDASQTRNENNSCTSCPADQTETRQDPVPRWVAYTNNCPANQWGQIRMEREQRREETRTGTYNCPAGTITVPPISWGNWSYGNYSNTGDTRLVSNDCTNCPSNRTETQEDFRWDAYENNCPANQYGAVHRERELRRTRTRTGTYSCPAGTTTAPSISWSSWSGWSSFSTTGRTQPRPPSSTSNTCQGCPTLSNETRSQKVVGDSETRWQNGSGNQVCRQTEQKRERRRTQNSHRTRTYVCPAGTKTLPGITYGSWSSWTNGSWDNWGGWSNTGRTRNRAGYTGSEERNINTCGFGQYQVTSGAQRRTFTCSGGNMVWSGWTTVRFSQCCMEGQHCQIQ